MQLAQGRVFLENPVNHKLRVLVRVEVDPGHVTLEVTGCLTQANYPALLHIMRRASRLAAGSDVSIDLHGSSHLDPEILLYLRQLAATQAEGFRLLLQEPAELPICLLHVGSDGEVLAGLDGDLRGAVNGRLTEQLEQFEARPARRLRRGGDQPGAGQRGQRLGGRSGSHRRHGALRLL